MSTADRTATTDEELMRRVKDADDADAFGCLYDRHAARAYRVARSVCGDPQRSQDAVQDGFLSIWRRRSRFHDDRGTFQAWSMSVVRYAAIDVLRRENAAKRPRSAANGVEDVSARSASPEDQAVSASESESLRVALVQLPDAQAVVIGLAFFGELSHSEIAQQLDLPAGTVKGRMRLGLEKLRSELDRAV